MMTRDVAALTPLGGKRWWLGVLLAPLAWVLVEGVGYVLSARECSPHTDALATRIRLQQLAVSAVGLAMAIAGLRIALAHRRALRTLNGGESAPIVGRTRFMATSGVVLGLLFTGGILLFAVSALITDVCERARS